MPENVTETSYERYHMANHHRIILIIYNVLINGVVSTLLNIFVIIGLIKTKQLRRTRSIQQVFALSISDTIGAVSVTVLLTLLLTIYAGEFNLVLEMVTLFQLTFTGHVSGFIVVLIASGRHVGVKSLRRTQEMPLKKMILIMTGVVSLAVMDGVLYVMASIYQFMFTASLIVMSIDCIFFLLALRNYVSFATVLQRKRSRANSENLRSRARDEYMIGIARKILFSMIAIAIVYVTGNVLFNTFHEGSNEMWKGHFEFIRFLGYSTIHTHGGINAAIFIYGNKTLRRLWRNMFGMNRAICVGSASDKKAGDTIPQNPVFIIGVMTG